MSFCREPTPDDFTRWHKHSPRVRCIHSQDPRKVVERLACNVYDMLQARCPKPCLPSLCSLSCPEGPLSPNNGVLLPVRFYFSRSLQAVKLDLVDHPDFDHLRDVIRDLAMLAPHVESLKLSERSTDQLHSLRGIEIAQLSRLTSFIGHGVSIAFDALLALGRLPCVRTVYIQPRAEPSDWDELSREPHGGFFAALQELDLVAMRPMNDTHEYCLTLLKTITPTSLHSVTLYLRRPENNETEALFTSFSVALGGLTCPGTLQHITIFLGNQDHADHSIILHSPCFEPLLALHALRSLRVQQGAKVVVDDSMLDAMSRAWPALHTLEFEWPRPRWRRFRGATHQLPPGTDAPDRPRATLAGLVPLVRRCADLRELAVAVDMRSAVPDFDGLGHPPVPLQGGAGCKVRRLQTCGWLVGDDVFAVASFLSLVFPELSHIEWSPPGSRAWRRFEVTYRRLVVVRTQEGKWALRNGKDHKQPVSL
ncbi:hypothetical protein VTO73DRAFT_10714 [Trametes versicolor]